ncbi:MAG TPA: phosphoglycolate phosphatase [Blastocatellia bacterium]|nr:phosphoglycolate phosphatase [Blastocatellia bacterium]
MKYRCLLFDLDGTLVDSRADLTTGINLMLGDLGRGPLPADHVLRFVGEGVRLLVERALRATQPAEPGGAEVDAAIERFRRHYRAHLCDRTRPYPGVEEALARFAALPKAVVTNKPYDLSLALLEGLGLRAHFAAVIGGDSLPERKPAPAPMLAAAARCGSDPAACLMVGDTAVDMLAGRAAGMTTCGFVGGFRGRAELARAGADVLIEEFAELRWVVEGG